MKQGEIVLVVIVAFAAFAGVIVFFALRLQRRRTFIDDYGWPRGLRDKLQVRHPGLSRADQARVENGLRQFFLAYLDGGGRCVAMPSQVVDDLWHEFILYTRAYKEFCQNAFGDFLHHTPAQALARAQSQSNAGLRRMWKQCCAQEGIDPHRPKRLPLLFALDAELGVANGFHYALDCQSLRGRGLSAPYCGGDFTDSSFDGTTDGLGGSSHGGGDGHGGHGHGGHGHGGDGHGGDSGGHGCGGHGCGGHGCGGGGGD